MIGTPAVHPHQLQYARAYKRPVASSCCLQLSTEHPCIGRGSSKGRPPRYCRCTWSLHLQAVRCKAGRRTSCGHTHTGGALSARPLGLERRCSCCSLCCRCSPAQGGALPKPSNGGATCGAVPSQLGRHGHHRLLQPFCGTCGHRECHTTDARRLRQRHLGCCPF